MCKRELEGPAEALREGLAILLVVVILLQYDAPFLAVDRHLFPIYCHFSGLLFKRPDRVRFDRPLRFGHRPLRQPAAAAACGTPGDLQGDGTRGNGGAVSVSSESPRLKRRVINHNGQ